ncbi:hypothetical protein FHU30_002057 [Actinomadura rupiterrae]|nr:hypothetical protein [Actinomadura rupiterrae]
MAKHEGDKPQDKPVQPIMPSKNGDRPDKGGKHEKGK